MWSYLNIAYNMLVLLYETVPALGETWAECLGDLTRYDMLAAASDKADVTSWRATAYFWYRKASNILPSTGRSYHHLAIITRPNSIQ